MFSLYVVVVPGKGWVCKRGFTTLDKTRAHRWHIREHAQLETKRFVNSYVERLEA